jgi:adenosylhomocysteine nucleosidase
VSPIIAPVVGPVVAVVGLAREARIAAGPGVTAVVAGAARAGLVQRIDRAIAEGGRAIISFGLAGGLDPDLRPGTCVIGRAIVFDGERLTVDSNWADRLAERLPDARSADIAASGRPLAEVAAKQALRRATGASAVDMESAIAAKLAGAHGLPFAALRVICDPAGQALPPAALAGFADDGGTDFRAILRSLAAAPGQLPALLRLAFSAQRAFGGLRRCRKALATGFDIAG